MRTASGKRDTAALTSGSLLRHHDLLVTLTITLPRFVVVFSPEYHQSGGRANAALTAPGLCEVTMPTANSIWIDITGLLAILLLVAANGFFVAAEFSLVAVRRSRVTQLVAEGQRRARALKRTIDHLDANLAATQLGITISSLALGWIG